MGGASVRPKARIRYFSLCAGRCRDEGRIGYHMHLGLDDWPATFHDLAAWLRELSRYIYIDRFGAARIAAVADTLDRHPARTRGPQLLHNLHTRIAGQLLTPAGAVTDLVFASPFLDERLDGMRGVG